MVPSPMNPTFMMSFLWTGVALAFDSGLATLRNRGNRWFPP